MRWGLLLRGADHNLRMHTKRIQSESLDVDDVGHELHENYRAMAVDPDDPVLAECRD